eukprot:Skav208523  [mRNA]  locus=scaffold1322:238335:248606:- [translate_table: standard]
MKVRRRPVLAIATLLALLVVRQLENATDLAAFCGVSLKRVSQAGSTGRWAEKESAGSVASGSGIQACRSSGGAGTDVVNAKSGKGSATLSMAYAGSDKKEAPVWESPSWRDCEHQRVVHQCRVQCRDDPWLRMGKKRVECAYVKSDLTVPAGMS